MWVVLAMKTLGEFLSDRVNGEYVELPDVKLAFVYDSLWIESWDGEKWTHHEIPLDGELEYERRDN